MPRQSWSGTISFGLVAIPVKLFSAVSKKSVSFNQLDERDMARIRYRKVNADTGAEVAEEHIVKGYEVSKGRYVVIDADDLEPLIPVLCEAMEATNKVALGRFVMRSKQYVAAIRALDGRLVMSTLVYANELIDPTVVPDLDTVRDVEVSDKEHAMAEMLVESLTSTFDVTKSSDDYSAQVMELIEAKAAGGDPVSAAGTAAKPKVVDIMAALEASVAEAKQARTRHPTVRKPGAKKSAPAKVAAAKRKPTPRKSA